MKSIRKSCYVSFYALGLVLTASAPVFPQCPSIKGIPQTSGFESKLTGQSSKGHCMHPDLFLSSPCSRDFKSLYHRQESALDLLCNAIVKRLSTDAKFSTQFIVAQDLWKKMRYRYCTFVAGYQKNKKKDRLTYLQCMYSMAKKRSKELEVFLNCPEGDVSCPLF